MADDTVRLEFTKNIYQIDIDHPDKHLGADLGRRLHPLLRFVKRPIGVDSVGDGGPSAHGACSQAADVAA